MCDEDSNDSNVTYTAKYRSKQREQTQQYVKQTLPGSQGVCVCVMSFTQI